MISGVKLSSFHIGQAIFRWERNLRKLENGSQGMSNIKKSLLLVSLLFLLFAVGETEASKRKHRYRVYRQYPRAVSTFNGFTYGFYQPRDYSKYYGGFHSRYFQDIGIPSGDIGTRGNGIYTTPW